MYGCPVYSSLFSSIFVFRPTVSVAYRADKETIAVKTTWKDDIVGVFLVTKNRAEILDIFSSERHKDFLPSIREFSEKELLVSVYSNYGELKKINT